MSCAVEEECLAKRRRRLRCCSLAFSYLTDRALRQSPEICASLPYKPPSLLAPFLLILWGNTAIDASKRRRACDVDGLSLFLLGSAGGGSSGNQSCLRHDATSLDTCWFSSEPDTPVVVKRLLDNRRKKEAGANGVTSDFDRFIIGVSIERWLPVTLGDVGSFEIKKEERVSLKWLSRKT